MNNKILRRTGMVYIVLLIIMSVANAGIPISDGFDYPVDRPDGLSFTNGEGGGGQNGWGFLEIGSDNHPGQDFNNPSGQDRGSPIYAVANGHVVYSGHYNDCGWGDIIMIEHKENYTPRTS